MVNLTHPGPEHCNPSLLKEMYVEGATIFVSDGHLEGQTAFGRYPCFQQKLIGHFNSIAPKDEVRILVAPGSIGCEALTLALMADRSGLTSRHGRVVIDTFDLSHKFTSIARTGLYPAGAIDHLGEMKDEFGIAAVPGFVRPLDHIANRVSILEPRSILEFEGERPYDAVITLNLFQWVRNAEQIFDRLVDLSEGLICVHQFAMHPFEKHLDDNHPIVRAGLRQLDADWSPYVPGNHQWRRTRDALACNNGVSVYSLI